MSTAKTSDQIMVERIDRVLALPGDLTRYSTDDRRVLSYIRENLTPKGLQKRADQAETEADKSVKHLHDVAKQRLATYEKEQTSTDD